MKKSSIYLFLSFIAVFFMMFALQACGYVQKDVDGNIMAPDFHDGTWSTCTYSRPDGSFFTPPPLQLGGVPMGHGQPDGTKIECVGIPKAAASDPAPEKTSYVVGPLMNECKTCHQVESPRLIKLE